VIGVGLLAAGVVFAAMPALAATPVLGDPWLVTEVVDGDTIDVAQGPRTMTVRLVGINAPESGECWSDEATAALTELVGRGPVWLTVDVSDLDRYGRSLRYVVNAEGEDVGARLIEQGAAIATSYPPDTANDARYALLEEAARLAGRGLWAPEACGPRLSVVHDQQTGGRLRVLDDGIAVSELTVARARTVLRRLTEQCEYVVIAAESPTVEPATLVLAELADATVMIAQHGETKLRDAERAGTRLRRVGGAVLGVLSDPAKPGAASAAFVPRATGVSAG